MPFIALGCISHPSCRNPVQNGWGWQWAGRQESLSCDLTWGVSVKLDSLAADRSRRRTQIRGVRKRKLSEWGHRVRELRGFDADWLCLMLRKTRSILIGRILCLRWERLGLFWLAVSYAYAEKDSVYPVRLMSGWYQNQDAGPSLLLLSRFSRIQLCATP